jgi:hypothetical protein
MSIFFCLGRLSKQSVLARGFLVIFGKKRVFDGEGLLARRPIPNLEDHPLSAVRDYLFNVFADT